MANIRTLKLNLLADTENFGKNLKKASGQSESFAKKLGKNFAIAGAAIGGAAIAIGVDAVKAAISDQKSQKLLAVALKNTTKASRNSIKAVEDWITTQEMAYGISDDKLRPALGKLVRVTGDVKKSQDLLSQAMDISAGTGKDLSTVTDSLVRAQNGNLGALKKLGVPLDDATIKNKDLAKALKIADDRFKGAAKAAGNTFAGKLDKLKIAIDESKESMGTAILNALQPMAEKWLPKISEGVQNFVAGLTGQNGITAGAKKGQDSIFNLGQDIRGFFKFLTDHEEVLKRVATLIGAIFLGAKAAGTTAAMISALKLLLPVFADVTLAAGTAAAAEAATTGGMSLAAAGPAIVGIATALGITGLAAMYTWKDKKKDYKKDFKDALKPGSGLSVAKSTAQDLANLNSYGPQLGMDTSVKTKLVGTVKYTWNPKTKRWYTQDISGNVSLLPQEGNPAPSNFKAKNSAFNNGGSTVINLNGIVDAESARRTIESLLQQSSIRTGAVQVTRAVI